MSKKGGDKTERQSERKSTRTGKERNRQKIQNLQKTKDTEMATLLNEVSAGLIVCCSECI